MNQRYFVEFDILNFFTHHHKVMKKPITIGVIAVIATVLVTSAVDYSVIGAKPTNEIYAEGSSRGNGEFVCPDGNTKITEPIHFSVHFNEDETRQKGSFSAFTQGVQPQKNLSLSLWTGGINSGSYMFKGVGHENQALANICGTVFFELDEYTVWGKCGHDVVINFEVDNGLSGTSIGTVICV